MIERTTVVETARRALGTPWRHQGRLVPLGVDCAGLVIWTLRELGVTQYEPPPYQRKAQWGEFLRHFQDNLTEIPKSAMGVGDVLCLRQNVFPCHCGIVTEMGDDPKFIHSYIIRRKVVEERLTTDWRRLIRGVFHIPGVA